MTTEPTTPDVPSSLLSKERLWWNADAEQRLKGLGQKLLSLLTMSSDPRLSPQTKMLGSSLRLASQGLLPLLQSSLTSENRDIAMFVETTADFLRYVVTGEENDTTRELAAINVPEGWTLVAPVTGMDAADKEFMERMQALGMGEEEVAMAMAMASDPELVKRMQP